MLCYVCVCVGVRVHILIHEKHFLAKNYWYQCHKNINSFRHQRYIVNLFLFYQYKEMHLHLYKTMAI